MPRLRKSTKNKMNDYDKIGNGIAWAIKALIIGGLVLAAIMFGLGAWLF